MSKVLGVSGILQALAQGGSRTTNQALAMKTIPHAVSRKPHGSVAFAVGSCNGPKLVNLAVTREAGLPVHLPRNWPTRRSIYVNALTSTTRKYRKIRIFCSSESSNSFCLSPDADSNSFNLFSVFFSHLSKSWYAHIVTYKN